MSTKEGTLQLIRKMHNDVTIEEIMERLFLHQRVTIGRDQITRGETLTHEQVKMTLSKWIKQGN